MMRKVWYVVLCTRPKCVFNAIRHMCCNTCLTVFSMATAATTTAADAAAATAALFVVQLAKEV